MNILIMLIIVDNVLLISECDKCVISVCDYTVESVMSVTVFVNNERIHGSCFDNMFVKNFKKIMTHN